MALAYIETAIRSNPKIKKLDAAEAWFFVCSFCYCHEAMSDGRIEVDDLDAIVPSRSQRSGRTADALAARMVAVGLWEVEGTGWRVHDYLKYQQPKSTIERNRLAARDRMANNRANRKHPNENSSDERSRERSGERASTYSTEQNRTDQCSAGQALEVPTELPPPTATASSEPKLKKPKKPKPQQAELVEASTAQSEADPKPEKKLTDAQRLWNVYREAFFVDCGSYPTAQRHYFVQLDALLRQHTLAVLVDRLKVYFTSPAWIGKSGARDFGRFLKYIDSWALPEAETAEESVERMFVKGPQRMAQIANGRANPLLNGTNAP